MMKDRWEEGGGGATTIRVKSIATTNRKYKAV